MRVWLTRNSGVISERSSPSPAPAVPPATFDINSSRSGRRSVPRNAIVVSLANPIRSAHGGSANPIRSWKSRGICRPCRRGKLRGDIAAKDRGADMIEAAFEISPDFAANIGPALAKCKILAQVSPGLRVDHAFEQCKPVRTSSERIEGMFAEELQ